VDLKCEQEWCHVSGFLERIILRLSQLLGLKGQRSDVTQIMLADPIAVSEPVFVIEPEAKVVIRPVNRSRQFKLAMRLRYVAKVQRWKNGKKPKPTGKARANLKPKPVAAGLGVAGKAVKKRGPSLFPVKVMPATAKRPTTRIYIAKKPKKTAEIVAFPVRKPLPYAPRLRRAA
jgi:hypothetical protein